MRKISKTYLLLSLILGFLAPCLAAQTHPCNTYKDPQVLFVQIKDDHEPLVNVKKEGGIAVGPSPEIPDNKNYFYIRKGLYEKLLAAQKLLPNGLHFCIYEGYRSLALQKKLFQGRFKKIAKLHPEWSYQQKFLETSRLVAPLYTLSGAKNIPAHSTGGAVDIYLIDDQGNAVDMGIHPKDWMKDTYGKLSLPNSKAIPKKARYYRHVMDKALSTMGLQNIDTEYWHWSYGDPYWAFKKKKPYAIYGPAKNIPKE